ncbi:uncharacterized protein LOC110441573 [Mizuhopecten yessoensis]|uniref:uncharacterized protein LOC110441573 n=1 Tax=Mizuhopecten yessoensis TaxID=6573 RepID=UPI000B45EE7F|nr:uncharacterized protein LOC110441573 [Mizuhopecten yessoensis]
MAMTYDLVNNPHEADVPVPSSTDTLVPTAADAPVPPFTQVPVPPATNAPVPHTPVPDVINDPILQTSAGADAPVTSDIESQLTTGDDLDLESSFNLSFTSSLLDLVSSSPDKSKSRLKTGQFVRVTLPFGKRQKDYIAEIVDVKEDEEEVLLKYMKGTTVAGHYMWPDKDDFSWENYQSVKELLPMPLLSSNSTNRCQFFKF